MMKNRYIPRSEILNLYTSSLKEVSTFTISEWLKSKIYKQFIVIEREFVMDAIQYIEIDKYSDGFLGRDIREKWDLKTIKFYL